MRGPLANGFASDTVDMDNADDGDFDVGDDRTMEDDDDDGDDDNPGAGANPVALDTIMARDDTINNFIFSFYLFFV